MSLALFLAKNKASDISWSLFIQHTFRFIEIKIRRKIFWHNQDRYNHKELKKSCSEHLCNLYSLSIIVR